MIRPFNSKDCEQVIALWKKTGIYYKPWDRKENLLKKHRKDPELLVVAVEDKKIVGAAIGQYDGWGAYIHHLAVDPKYQGKGIAKKVIEKLEKTLKRKGAKSIFVFTYPCSEKSAFFKKIGYKNWGLSDGLYKDLK